ncbi:MAG TPA: hypothetical protein VEJ18_06445 [Planctomycetota bacterium]|nr:hypothetical protein [Planctomycetota bacterium]
MTRFAAVLALLVGCTPPPKAAPKKVEPWTVAEGLQAPESAYVVPGTRDLFVSQVAGVPTDKDGNGRIAKMTIDGAVVKADWVSGLNAPKGLRSHGGTLWVADIDQVLGISLADGKITHRVQVADAKFLNDVAVGHDGTVYVSDMALSRIYAIKGGAVTVWADGPELEHPNGLLVVGGSLVVAAWGKPSEDFSTKVPGRLYRLDLQSKQKTLITKEPTGNLDGLESDGRGGFVVTDWMAGKVLHITGEGTARVIRTFAQGTADHAYVAAQDLLLLPHMLQNKIEAITPLLGSP